MRKRRRGRCGNNNTTVCALCFGLGLLLSVFCSARFALFLAAVALVYIAATCRS